MAARLAASRIMHGLVLRSANSTPTQRAAEEEKRVLTRMTPRTPLLQSQLNLYLLHTEQRLQYAPPSAGIAPPVTRLRTATRARAAAATASAPTGTR